jgi:hypothetical protein
MSTFFSSFLRTGLIAIGLGVAFSWFGVYGTNEMPLLIRTIYWIGLMILGFACSAIVTPMVFDHWLKDRPPAIQIAVTTILISLPITAGLLLLGAAGGSMPHLDEWPIQFGYVVVVSAVLTTGAWAVDKYAEQKAAVAAGPAAGTPVPAQPPGPSPFAERLPLKLRVAEIYAVSAEDHYLRVHTSAGQELILMRLADAIRELKGLEGLQTHRSWWVARQGLADVMKNDGKLALKIKSGAEAPVSRTYLKAVRDAGWL